MNDSTTPITAAILAGGAARRMGRTKHDLSLEDGRMMVELVLEACREVTDQVVVSGPEVILPDLPHVTDRVEGGGPLSGLDALLASGLGDRYLVVPCDMPGLLGEDLLRLVRTEGDLVVFAHDAKEPPRSLPAVFHARLGPSITERLESDDRSLHGFISNLDAGFVEPPPAERLVNINDPDDWSNWCASRDDG